MKEMMRQVLEDGLTAELDDELGYTRYDLSVQGKREQPERLF